MTSAQFIDALIQHALELKLSDSYVTTEWRPRVLFFAKSAAGLFWDAFPDDCDFKQGISTALVLVNGEVAYPAAFSVIGAQGGVFSGTTGKQLEYVNPKYFWPAFRQTSPQTSGAARQYTIADGRIFTYPKTSDDTLILHYRKRRPVLIDNTDVSGTVTDNGLTQIPAEYHEGPLFWATWDMLAVLLGDGRVNTELSPRAKKMFDDAVAQRTQGAEQMFQIGDKGISELEMY